MFCRYHNFDGMKIVPGSNGKSLYNSIGEIKDRNGTNLPSEVDSEGHLIVKLTAWDGERYYRIIDFIAVHLKFLTIPREDFNKVIGFCIDGNKENTSPCNIGYRFKGGKLESREFSGFFYIPGIPTRLINLNGDVKSLLGDDIKYYVMPPNKKKNILGGYRLAQAGLVGDKRLTLSRHRSLCLVFKEYPDNVDNLVVIHIDGVPGNDVLDNLEWITRGENNVHAYMNNLKKQQKAILVRNAITGEVKEYYSISEAARVMGWKKDGTVWDRIRNRPFSAIFSDGYQFKLKEDTRDWIIFDDPVAEMNKAKLEIPVRVLNCFTMEEVVYDSVTDAADETGVNGGTIHWRLKRGNEKPLSGYLFKLATDSSDWYRYTKEELEESLNPITYTVNARNHFTKEEKTFDSIHQAELETKAKNLRAHLRRGEQPLYSTGWQLKLEDAEWEEFDDVFEEIYRRTNEVSARCEATGKIILARSSRNMAEVLGLDPKTIRYHAMTKGRSLYRGYRFRLGYGNDSWPRD